MLRSLSAHIAFASMASASKDIPDLGLDNTLDATIFAWPCSSSKLMCRSSGVGTSSVVLLSLPAFLVTLAVNYTIVEN